MQRMSTDINDVSENVKSKYYAYLENIYQYEFVKSIPGYKRRM